VREILIQNYEVGPLPLSVWRGRGNYKMFLSTFSVRRLKLASAEKENYSTKCLKTTKKL